MCLNYFFGQLTDASYVVDTDYETYQISWSCNQLSEFMKRDKLYILVRDPKMKEDDIKVIYDKAKQKLEDLETEQKIMMKYDVDRYTSRIHHGDYCKANESFVY